MDGVFSRSKIYAMFIKLYAKNNLHLLSIIHHKFQKIKGIASTETLISFDEAFKRQVPLTDLDVERETGE